MSQAMHPVAVARRMVERYGPERAEWRVAIRMYRRRAEYRNGTWDHRRCDGDRAAFLVVFWNQVHRQCLIALTNHNLSLH